MKKRRTEAGRLIAATCLLLVHGLHASPPKSATLESESSGTDFEAPIETREQELGSNFVQIVNDAGAKGEQMELLRDTFDAALLEDDSLDRLRQALTYMHEEFAPLKFQNAELVEWKTPSGVQRKLHTFALDERRKQWKNIQMDVSDEAIPRITGISFVADVSEPVYLPAGDIRHEIEWLDTYVNKLIREDDLFGSLVIVEEGKVLYERYFGFEDARRSRPISEATRFNMASGGKMFAGVAIAQLVEEGKLEWSASVSRYIPGVAEDLQVRHLLNHSAGISNYWTEENEQRMASATDPQQEFLELALEAGTDFEPGTAVRYSNSNFILAGHVVEAASGRDYFDYVRSEILEPSGMTHTLLSVEDDFSRDVAEALRGEPFKWERIDFNPRPTSAGGSYTTGRDMVRFSQALTNGALLSGEMLDVISTSTLAGVPDALDDFGYGFQLSTQGQTDFFGHGGLARGVNFGFEIVRARDLTLVMFSNQDNGAFDDLKKNVMKLISGFR